MRPALTAARSAATGPGSCRILILAALPQEVRPFLRRSRARPRAGLGVPAWEVALGAGAGLVALSGMGAAAARRAAAVLLTSCRPQILVSLGFAGALTAAVPPGTLVLGESFWHYETATSSLQPAAAPGPPRPLSALLAHLRDAGLPAVTGAVVTTPRVIDKAGQGAPLKKLPQPVLDLETAALAAVATTAGLGFVSLRAVTDGAGEEIPEFLRLAAGHCAPPGVGAALRWLAADPWRLVPLLRLWRRSRRAGALLAQGLVVLLPLLFAGAGELQGQPAQKGEVDEDPHPA